MTNDESSKTQGLEAHAPAPLVQDLARFKLPPRFRGRSAAYVQLWWIVEALFFRPSPQVLYGWRRFLLRLFGAKVGRQVLVRPSARITYPWKLALGDHCWIGDDVVLYTLGPIEIGSNTVISQRSYLCTGSHDYRAADFSIYARKIIIGRECWLGADVFVGPGVTIGQGAVVGARSSVFRDLPAMGVYVGSPARFVRIRQTGSSVGMRERN